MPFQIVNPRLASQEEWAKAYFDLHGRYTWFVGRVRKLAKSEDWEGIRKAITDEIAQANHDGIV